MQACCEEYTKTGSLYDYYSNLLTSWLWYYQTNQMVLTNYFRPLIKESFKFTLKYQLTDREWDKDVKKVYQHVRTHLKTTPWNSEAIIYKLHTSNDVMQPITPLDEMNISRLKKIRCVFYYGSRQD